MKKIWKIINLGCDFIPPVCTVVLATQLHKGNVTTIVCFAIHLGLTVISAFRIYKDLTLYKEYTGRIAASDKFLLITHDKEDTSFAHNMESDMIVRMGHFMVSFWTESENALNEAKDIINPQD